MAVRNNGGGYFNHTFYWESMKHNGGGLPTGKLKELLLNLSAPLMSSKNNFQMQAKTRFGSGWAWLCLDPKGALFICSIPNQDNPLMDIAEKKGDTSSYNGCMGHAYYLKYQNKRADYIDAFWNVVNWEEVARRYETALKSVNPK